MRLITGLGSLALATSVAVTAGAQNADLQVEKSGPATASPSGAIYYNIRVTNLGPDTADGPQLIDVFPAGWTIDFFNDDGSGWECMVLKSIPGEIVCEAPSLNPGGYADFQLSISDPGMTSSPGDTVTNIATVSSATLDPDPSNDVSSVNTLLADPTNVQVLKDNGVTTVGPGDTVVYRITVAAIDSYSAYQVSVTDIVPPELSSCTWTCAGSACPNASGSGSIEETVDLEYLESDTVVYTLVCTVNALAVGTITNTATATLPPGQVDVNPDDNSATDTDMVVATADLSVTKTDGVTGVVPGGSLTYSIVAMNAGPSPVIGAALADTFPTELDCDWTCVGTACPVAAGSGAIAASLDLAVSESVTYTASCTVSTDATDIISNTATIAAPAGVTDPDPGNNAATDDDEVLPPLGPGMVTTYSIVIDSNGNGIPDPEDERLVLTQLPEGFSVGGGPWDLILLSSADTDGDGILDQLVYFHPGGLTQAASFVATKRETAVDPQPGAAAVAAYATNFTFRETRADGSTSATGMGGFADGDGDGWIDHVVGGGSGLQVELGFVGSDVTGDGHADYLSIPWSQASLIGIDGTDGAPDPQVWIPLADTDGDGIPDSVVIDLDGDGVADSDKLGSPPIQPGYQPGPTIQAIPVLGDWGLLLLLTALAAAGWWLLRWRSSAP